MLYSLFYLLGMLSVDLIMDQSKDESMQMDYYCTLIRSFTSVLGALRMVPAALTLAVSSILALKTAPISSKRLHYFHVFLLVFLGLPAFFFTAFRVNEACQSGLYPSSTVLIAHYAIFVILATCITLMFLAKRSSSLIRLAKTA